MLISNDAEAFIDAARILRAEKPPTFKPLYFLACQSIELSMKAFLRGSGYSEKQLRNIGHNLNKCVVAAIDKGIEDHVRLSDADVAMIDKINPYYQYKDLQYSKAGFKSYPRIDELIALGERMQQDLRQFCVDRRGYHVDKPTAIA